MAQNFSACLRSTGWTASATNTNLRWNSGAEWEQPLRAPLCPFCLRSACIRFGTACLRRWFGRPQMTESIRLFDGARIDAMTPERLQSAECILIPALHSESFGVHFREKDGSWSKPMVGCFRVWITNSLMVFCQCAVDRLTTIQTLTPNNRTLSMLNTASRARLFSVCKLWVDIPEKPQAGQHRKTNLGLSGESTPKWAIKGGMYCWSCVSATGVRIQAPLPKCRFKPA